MLNHTYVQIRSKILKRLCQMYGSGVADIAKEQFQQNWGERTSRKLLVKNCAVKIHRLLLVEAEFFKYNLVKYS